MPSCCIVHQPRCIACRAVTWRKIADLRYLCLSFALIKVLVDIVPSYRMSEPAFRCISAAQDNVCTVVITTESGQEFFLIIR